jgi:NADPH:quinone reductase-like Zn-dependent oxidoreductase
MARLVSLIEQDLLKPLLAQSFPLRELGKAQKMFMQKQHVGNIAIEI